MDIADFINEAPPSARLGMLNRYMQEEQLAAPIDMYRKSMQALLDHGSVERLEELPFLVH